MRMTKDEATALLTSLGMRKKYANRTREYRREYWSLVDGKDVLDSGPETSYSATITLGGKSAWVANYLPTDEEG